MTFSELSHLDPSGKARMVDVSGKVRTLRTARAYARVSVNEPVIEVIQEGGVEKGDVLTVAQLAGIMAAKQTGHLIPLCHPIVLDHVHVSLKIDQSDHTILIESEITAFEKTGVEMEALMAVSIAALTVYDMVKSIDKRVIIEDIHLVEKTGGKSGDFHFEQGK